MNKICHHPTTHPSPTIKRPQNKNKYNNTSSNPLIGFSKKVHNARIQNHQKFYPNGDQTQVASVGSPVRISKFYAPADSEHKFQKLGIENLLRIEPAAWESPKLGTCSSTNNGREPQNFIYPSIKSWNNPGNIPLKLCKCSQIPHSSPRVASTSNRTKTNHYWLSIYKHFTRTKLRKPAREKTEGKLPNLWDNTEKS